jgi:hypothetical protein
MMRSPAIALSAALAFLAVPALAAEDTFDAVILEAKVQMGVLAVYDQRAEPVAEYWVLRDGGQPVHFDMVLNTQLSRDRWGALISGGGTEESTLISAMGYRTPFASDSFDEQRNRTQIASASFEMNRSGEKQGMTIRFALSQPEKWADMVRYYRPLLEKKWSSLKSEVPLQAAQVKPTNPKADIFDLSSLSSIAKERRAVILYLPGRTVEERTSHTVKVSETKDVARWKRVWGTFDTTNITGFGPWAEKVWIKEVETRTVERDSSFEQVTTRFEIPDFGQLDVSNYENFCFKVGSGDGFSTPQRFLCLKTAPSSLRGFEASCTKHGS